MNNKFLKSCLLLAIAAFISLSNIMCNKVYASDNVSYEVNKVPLDLSAESNGIKITLKEANYDGKYMNILYEVDTDKDLGEYIYVGGIDSEIRTRIYDEGKEYAAIGGGGSKTRKSGENKYNGKYHESISDIYLVADEEKEINYKINLDTIYSKLHIDEIGYNDTKTDEHKLIKGEWNFPYIELKSLGRAKYDINKEFEKEKATLELKSLEISPIQLSIIYEEDFKNTKYDLSDWTSTGVSFKIKDDLGNSYEFEGGEGQLLDDQKTFINQTDFEGLNKTINKITLYPEICFWRHLEGEILNEKGELVPNVERKYITFDDIEIDLNSLK